MLLVVSFWMKIIRCFYHPILDVSCRQFLDENYASQLSYNVFSNNIATSTTIILKLHISTSYSNCLCVTFFYDVLELVEWVPG